MYFILDFRSLCRSFCRKKMKVNKKSFGKFTWEDMHGFHFRKYFSAIYGEMIHIFFPSFDFKYVYEVNLALSVKVY